MPIKKTSSFTRNDYEYESPDGDKYSITLVETDERKYVEIKREDEEPTRWDQEMLSEIYCIVQQHSKKTMRSVPQQSSLLFPQITDHRSGSPTTIEKSVTQTMNRMDEDVDPIESFDPEKPIDEEQEDEIEAGNMTEWQKEARRRMQPRVKDIEKSVKRVGAADLI